MVMISEINMWNKYVWLPLQTLPFFVVGKDSDSIIKELKSLNGLGGQLSIYNLQEVKDKKEAEKANLRGKTKIYKLEFVWRSRRKCFKNDEEVLEALQSHSNLETLKIEHYGGEKLPCWLLMEIPSHGDSLLVNSLVNLKFIDCKSCELPMLGRLPRLKSLEIDGLDNVRATDMEFYRSTGFSETMAVFPALKKTVSASHGQSSWMDGASSGWRPFSCVSLPWRVVHHVLSSIGKFFTECFITCSTGNLLLWWIEIFIHGVQC